MPNQVNSSVAFVTVFGSSLIRVSPDRASVALGVSRVGKEPTRAFDSARKAAASVQEFLRKGKFGDFGSSRVTLTQEFRYTQGQQKPTGYRARIGYSIVLRDLDRIEELLSGVVAAGANELNSVVFETTRLKEVRADARRQAVAAAREKAELYCKEAGVAVAKVISIQDSNPDELTGRREGHVRTGGAGGVGDERAFDPAMITVGASVNITYEISRRRG